MSSVDELQNNLVKKLIDKSIEAFTMAIEIYNKPTIRYRVEGFSFFISNAWELMLKAHLIKTKGEKSIYYKNNPDRTLSVEVCVKKAFTNDKDPLRLNLEKIIELRNTSTHFITEDYEMVYIPLFQACVLNFADKLQEFHEIDISQIIPYSFLNLIISIKNLNENEIRAKYPEEIATKLVCVNESISNLVAENNHAFAIKIDHHHYITKDKSKATSFVNINNDAEAEVKIIKELKNPNETHKYSAKNCIKEIEKRLRKTFVNWKFNKFHFGLFCKYYDIKNKDSMCFINKIYQDPQYSYSQQTIDFIIAEICKDPDNIIETIKRQINKPTPGAKDSKR